MTSDTEPSTVTYTILGLLTCGATTGYDVLKLARETVGFIWSPTKSHVYAELRALDALGWATARRVRQTDRPDKRVYRITSAGRKALVAWLNETSSETETQALLRIFFGHLVSENVVAAHVRRVGELAADRERAYRKFERDAPRDARWVHPMLTLRFGLAQVSAARRWADQTSRELRQGSRDAG